MGGSPLAGVSEGDHAQGIAVSSDGTYLLINIFFRSFIAVYKRNGQTYDRLNDIETGLTGTLQISFSDDDTYLVVAGAGGLQIYKRNGDNFTLIFSGDSDTPAQVVSAKLSPDGNYLAVGGGSPSLTIYKRNGDTFTKIPGPDLFPGDDQNPSFNSVLGLSFSPDSTYLATGHTISPSFSIYKRSGDTFTKLPSADIAPATNVRSLVFSGDGNYVAIFSNSTPYLTIYKRNGDAFNKLPAPDVLPGDDGNQPSSYVLSNIDFTSDGRYLAVANKGFPGITVYKREGDIFTKLPNPIALPPGDAICLDLSVDGNYLAVGHFNSPNAIVYELDYTIELLGSTTNYSGVLKSVVADNDFIYAAGEQDPTQDSVIVKYSKETLQAVGTSIAIGGAVDKLEQDGDFIYALSIDAETIKQYAKSDLSLMSTLTIDNMQSFTQDTDFIYSFEALLGELSKSTKGSLSYNLTKAVSGITAEDDPIVDIDLSTNNFSDVVPIQEAWGLVYRLDTLEDEVKLYAPEEPEFPANTTVKLKVVK